MDLVTGGLGFIGNELVRQLTDKGRKVAIVDNKNRIAPDIDDIKNVPIYEVDITDNRKILQVMDELQPDRVFHLAAIHYIPECNQFPERTLQVNVEGLYSVLNASIKTGVKHFVFASTGAVYADSSEKLSEEHPIAPVDIYGWSKWFSEDLCRWKSTEIPITICRLFNNAGLRETNPHIIPEIMMQLKKSNTLQLGNIKPIRDYIDTRDTADAFIKVGDLIPKDFDIYNFATGEGCSVEDLITLIRKISGRDIVVKIDESRFRKADKQYQVGNVHKLKSKSGWQNNFSLEDTLNELLKYEKLI